MNEEQMSSIQTDRLHSDEKAITAALARAVRKAFLFHKQTGHPIYIWENGQVVRREARDIKVIISESQVNIQQVEAK